MQPPNIDESRFSAGPPGRLVEETARAKAEAARHRAPRGATILAADTIVDLDGVPVGKPADEGDARRILRSLSGRSHTVWTGVAVLDPQGCPHAATARTDVEFAALGPREVESYVASGEPLGKAGAYGIQSVPRGWIVHVRGDYYNVVGLPLRPTLRLLRESGFPLPPHLKVS